MYNRKLKNNKTNWIILYKTFYNIITFTIDSFNHHCYRYTSHNNNNNIINVSSYVRYNNSNIIQQVLYIVYMYKLSRRLNKHSHPQPANQRLRSIPLSQWETTDWSWELNFRRTIFRRWKYAGSINAMSNYNLGLSKKCGTKNKQRKYSTTTSERRKFELREGLNRRPDQIKNFIPLRNYTGTSGSIIHAPVITISYQFVHGSS